MQVGVFVLALIEGVGIETDDQPSWFSFSGLPMLTLFLLFAFRMAVARQKRQLSAI
jgi:hypothetical protein